MKTEFLSNQDLRIFNLRTLELGLTHSVIQFQIWIDALSKAREKRAGAGFRDKTLYGHLGVENKK